MQSSASALVHPVIPLSPDQLAAYCRAHHIRRLALFGSALHGTMDETSDVDVLVEFETGVPIGFFELIEAEHILSNLIGHAVDRNTPGFLSARFRARVLAEAQVLAEAH